MSTLLIANSAILPLRLSQIDTILLKNSLLDIPQELINLINRESFNIAQHEKRIDIDYCINAHDKFGLKCQGLCHLCKNNIVTIYHGSYKSYRNHEYSCCTDCYINEKYKNCLTCVKLNWHDYESINKFIYVTEQLPFKINSRYLITYIEACSLCYVKESESCVGCKKNKNDGVNLIKCYHYSLPHGKKIIYFCDDARCCLDRRYGIILNAINEKITIFENPNDRVLIEKRYIVVPLSKPNEIETASSKESNSFH